jgi:hypothetical protein
MSQAILGDQFPGIDRVRSLDIRVFSPFMLIWVVTAIFTLFSAPGRAEHAQTAQTLSQVKKIYVGSLGDKQGATELRNKLIQRLRKSSSIEIAASPGEADAIITGTGEIWIKGYSSANPKSPPSNRQPVYGGCLSIELKGKDNETLWSYRATPGKFLWNGVTQDLVNRLAKQLLKVLQRGKALGVESYSLHSRCQRATTSHRAMPMAIFGQLAIRRGETWFLMQASITG